MQSVISFFLRENLVVHIKNHNFEGLETVSKSSQKYI